MRFLALIIAFIDVVSMLALGALASVRFCWGLIIWVPLALVGLNDVLQVRHSNTRSYPIVMHFRFLLEAIRPEKQHHFVESDIDGRPFDRDESLLVREHVPSSIFVVAICLSRRTAAF